MNRVSSAASFTGVALVKRLSERCSGKPDNRLVFTGVGRVGGMAPSPLKDTERRPVCWTEPCGTLRKSESPPGRGVRAGGFDPRGRGIFQGGARWGPRSPLLGRRNRGERGRRPI